MKSLSYFIPSSLLSLLLVTSVTARADDACMTKSRAVKAAASDGSVPLDFDGDGFSDIGTVVKNGDNIDFTVTLSGNGQTAQSSVSGDAQAVGDYDGDGKADFAAVRSPARSQGDFRWTVVPSTAPTAPATVTLSGVSGERPIAGCRLLSPNRAAVALWRPSRGLITARELGSEQSTEIRYDARLKLIGCGDLDGDLQDELVFSTGERRGNDNQTQIVSIGCGKKPVIYRSVKDFESALFVPREPGLLPVLAFFRSVRDNRFVLDVQGISEQIAFAQTLTSGKADVASAFLKESEDSGRSAIVVRKKGSTDILASYVGIGGIMAPVKVGTVSDPRAELLQAQIIRR